MAKQKKKVANTSNIEKDTALDMPTDMTPWMPKKHNTAKYIAGGLIVIGGILFLTKGYFLAAIVNMDPIFRFEVNKVLNSRFGQQTVESMINEALIADAARKAGVSVSKEEIEAKEQEILAGLGPNVKLEDILKYQGITKEDFDKQISLELTVRKIVGRDIQVTDADVDAYIASNSALLTATEPAALKEEARQSLTDQKIAEKVQVWFSELRTNAKIVKF